MMDSNLNTVTEQYNDGRRNKLSDGKADGQSSPMRLSERPTGFVNMGIEKHTSI